MCGNQREMLDGALAGITEAERQRFEDDFQHFASYSQLNEMQLGGWWRCYPAALEWARWAFWSAGNYGRKG